MQQLHNTIPLFGLLECVSLPHVAPSFLEEMGVTDVG